MTNAEIIRKADFEFADLNDDGGLLNPEQAARFVRKLIQEPTLLRDVRVVEMSAPTRNINKIQFNKRVLRPGTSATALSGVAADSATAFDPLADTATRAKPLTEQIVLNTDEVIAEIHLPYDVIEDNVERGGIGQRDENSGANSGGGFLDTILALLAERAALDMEELAILGDTAIAATDPYLGLQDGYIKRIEAGGQVVDFLGAIVDKSLFKRGMKAMPDQYLRAIANLRHYVSFDQETEYRDSLADRATATGDASIQGRVPVTPFGVPLQAVSLMPDDKGIFTNPKNLIWGMQRRVHLERDKDISSRVIKIVLTARVALQIEEVTAAVVYNNIGV